MRQTGDRAAIGLAHDENWHRLCTDPDWSEVLMKRLMPNISWIVITTAAIAVGGASTARADERIVAKVPFAFIVGDRQLPAGDYVVKEAIDGSGVLGIANADGRHLALTMTIPSSTNTREGQPELVFEKFENHYFLARVAPQDGDEREIVLTPSIMEREIVRATDRSGN